MGALTLMTNNISLDLYNMATLDDLDSNTYSPFSNMNICKYYNTNQVLEFAKNLNQGNHKLSLFAQNCQSLTAHWDNLTNVLAELSSDIFAFDIIGLSEIFNLNNNHDYKLEGYQDILKGKPE